MSRFPQSETEIISLAHAIITGLNAHPDIFPSPPIKAEELQIAVTECLTLSDEVISVQSHLAEVINRKKAQFQKLSDFERQIVQYSEHATTSDKWPLIGWAARAAPVPLQAPGQVRNLVYTKNSMDSLLLKWDAPAEGGKPGIYHIYNHETPEGAWNLVSSVFEKEFSVNNLVTGKTFEFRVEAANKQGKGAVSNSIIVSL